jgi:hypothetical protein
MTSDAKTFVPSLINYIESDLFTFKNISSSVTLVAPEYDIINNLAMWDVVVSYLPAKFYKIIDTIPATIALFLIRTIVTAIHAPNNTIPKVAFMK